jgi:hypothetical protein
MLGFLIFTLYSFRVRTWLYTATKRAESAIYAAESEADSKSIKAII